MALGRHWVEGDDGKKIAADAAAWGIEIETEPDNISIWPEHVEAWNVFVACSTQWRVIAGMGGAFYQGLEYTSVEAVMRMMQVADTATCMRHIRLMEEGAVVALND